MLDDNILIANIGWSSAYEGEPVEGAMGYLVEHGTGAEAFNFRTGPGGLFYGYIRSGGLAKWLDTSWTVVFVSKPDGATGLRVVGWYENARLSGFVSREEYRHDPDFPRINKADGSSEPFIYNAMTRSAFFVSAASRAELFLPQGHPIKTGGIYYLTRSIKDDARQAALRCRIADWVRGTLPTCREGARIAAPTRLRPAALPGIDVPEDGKPGGFSSVAESPDHAALRRWALSNPAAVTGARGPFRSETEASLPSGDRVDVVHEQGDRCWVVEVKSWRSSDEDHRRGVFQCVKYRAVAAAERALDVGAVTAILVTQRELSSELARAAAALDIVHRLAPKPPA